MRMLFNISGIVKLKKSKALFLVLISIMLGSFFGCGRTSKPIENSAPINDHRNTSCLKIGDMTLPRYGHHSFLLSNGDVLLLGGTASPEILSQDKLIFSKLKKRSDLSWVSNALQLANDLILVIESNKLIFFNPMQDNVHNVYLKRKLAGESFKSYLMSDGSVVIFPNTAYSKKNSIKTARLSILRPETAEISSGPVFSNPELLIDAIPISGNRLLIVKQDYLLVYEGSSNRISHTVKVPFRAKGGEVLLKSRNNNAVQIMLVKPSSLEATSDNSTVDIWTYDADSGVIKTNAPKSIKIEGALSSFGTMKSNDDDIVITKILPTLPSDITEHNMQLYVINGSTGKISKHINLPLGFPENQNLIDIGKGKFLLTGGRIRGGTDIEDQSNLAFLCDLSKN
jgi:hypothetical protein